MPRTAAVILLLFVSTFGLAQPASDEPPVADRPVDFSNLVGVWSLRVEAEPTEVRVEESITLRVFISGDGPPKYTPNRKFLQLFPDGFENDFYIKELRDEHRVMPEAKTWLFVYRLKPKHEKVKEIDGLALWYYNPKSPSKRKFVPAFAAPIALVVKPKLDATSDIEIVADTWPDSYYAIPPTTALTEHETPFQHHVEEVTLILMLMLTLTLTLPAFLCVLGVLAWRCWLPNDAERARRIRQAAAAHALAALHHGHTDPRYALCRYLADRFDFAVADPTPADVSAFLSHQGLSRVSCTAAEQFFAQCDEARFSGSTSGNRERLASVAIPLIQQMEADRCARS